MAVSTVRGVCGVRIGVNTGRESWVVRQATTFGIECVSTGMVATFRWCQVSGQVKLQVDIKNSTLL